MTNRRARQWFVDAGAILTALVFLVPVVWLLVQEHRLSTDGMTATGVVRSKALVRGGNENPSEYYVAYGFEDASGTEHTGTTSVDDTVYDRVSLGEALPIEYLADQPQTSRIAGVFNPRIGEAGAMAGLGMVVFFFLGPQRWFREWRGGHDPALTN